MENEPDLKRNTDYGPYLNAAFLCEKVLTDKEDGANSAIRIVDRLTYNHRAPSENPSAQTAHIPPQLVFYLSLKAGENPGTTSIKVVLKKPDNTELQPLKTQIHLDSPSNRGGNVVINLAIPFDQGGVWWFDVYVNEVWRTKVPLEVIFLSITG